MSLVQLLLVGLLSHQPGLPDLMLLGKNFLLVWIKLKLRLGGFVLKVWAKGKPT